MCSLPPPGTQAQGHGYDNQGKGEGSKSRQQEVGAIRILVLKQGNICSLEQGQGEDAGDPTVPYVYMHSAGVWACVCAMRLRV